MKHTTIALLVALAVWASPAWAVFEGKPWVGETNWHQIKEQYNPNGQIWTGYAQRVWAGWDNALNASTTPDLIGRTFKYFDRYSNQVITISNSTGQTLITTNRVAVIIETTVVTNTPSEFYITNSLGTNILIRPNLDGLALSVPYNWMNDDMEFNRTYVNVNLKTSDSYNDWFDRDHITGGTVTNTPGQMPVAFVEGLMSAASIGFVTNLSTNAFGLITGGDAYFTKQPFTNASRWPLAQIAYSTNGWIFKKHDEFETVYWDAALKPFAVFVNGDTNGTDITRTVNITSGDVFNPTTQTTSADTEDFTLASDGVPITLTKMWNGIDAATVTNAGRIGDTVLIYYQEKMKFWNLSPATGWRLWLEGYDQMADLILQLSESNQENVDWVSKGETNTYQWTGSGWNPAVAELAADTSVPVTASVDGLQPGSWALLDYNADDTNSPLTNLNWTVVKVANYSYPSVGPLGKTDFSIPLSAGDLPTPTNISWYFNVVSPIGASSNSLQEFDNMAETWAVENRIRLSFGDALASAFVGGYTSPVMVGTSTLPPDLPSTNFPVGEQAIRGWTATNVTGAGGGDGLGVVSWTFSY